MQGINNVRNSETQRQNVRRSTQFLGRIIDSLLGAAFRLHRYRDAQDALLRRAFYEQELRIVEEYCCDE